MIATIDEDVRTMSNEGGAKSRKLTARSLRARYDHVSDRTIGRWTESGILPQPMLINGVRYWDEEEVEQRDRERVASATS
jgi:hypothetical protein